MPRPTIKGLQADLQKAQDEVVALRDKRPPRYPFDDGETLLLGPEVFASKDGKVISWRGENYVPQASARFGENLSATLTAKEQALSQALEDRQTAWRARDEALEQTELFSQAVTSSAAEHGVKDRLIEQLEAKSEEYRLRALAADALVARFKVAIDALQDISLAQWPRLSSGLVRTAKQALESIRVSEGADEKFAEPEEGVDGSNA